MSHLFLKFILWALFFWALFTEQLFFGLLIAGELCQFWEFGQNIVISTFRMWNHTICAIFNSFFRVSKIPTTLFPKSIQWAITKKAVELLRVCCLVTWEIFTFAVVEKRKFLICIFHNKFTPIMMSMMFLLYHTYCIYTYSDGWGNSIFLPTPLKKKTT